MWCNRTRTMGQFGKDQAEPGVCGGVAEPGVVSDAVD